MKRTFAAAIAAVTASTAMGLTATMAASAATAASAMAARPGPSAPSATLRVVPRWTYTDGGKLAVIAGCSKRGDVRVISSKLLPRPPAPARGGTT